MKKNTIKKVALLAIASTALLAVVGCGANYDEIAAKYTEQTALAIIDGSWKIAVSIIAGAFISGFLSS